MNTPKQAHVCLQQGECKSVTVVKS